MLRAVVRSLAAALVLALALGAAVAADPARKVLVLGVDGLDPTILQRYVDQGRMPNFKRLIAQGDFTPLETTMPPLSPIAWSTFITGMDPGGHGIYDFIHRKTHPFVPYSSMATTIDPERIIKVGSRCLPARDLLPGFMTEAPIVNLRKGPAFWEYLEDNGVSTTLFRMPVNFPPVAAGGHEFSGMGTPDIRGSLGEFSYFTDEPGTERKVTGGHIYPVRVLDNKVTAALLGPKDPFDCNNFPSTRDPKAGPAADLKAQLEVFIDPERPVARFQVGDSEFILAEGEWSEWVRVEFEAVKMLASVSSVGRFYLKQVRPHFKLYVSPLQINPEDPAQPISAPAGWSRELWDELGYFYTQQLPEDTKALENDVLSGGEFWHQGQIVYGERSKALDHFLKNFDEGLLFFYFSSVDQNSHMLWRYSDREHPGYVDAPELARGIQHVYEEIDEALGRAMSVIDDDDTLIVMSDHGFCPFYWQVSLNTWLLEKGYVALIDPSRQGEKPWFGNVDWSRTTAYAAGINGLYINLQGREKQGVVPPGEYEALLDRLERDLLEMRDPRNDQQPVTLVTRTRRDFHGPHLDIGPDIIVGYNWGYRGSWKTPLGEFPKEAFADNLAAWSGDHSVDHRVVPGVLITNKRITMKRPALYDLTVAILDEYGIEKPEEMIGRDCIDDAPVEALAERRDP